MIPRAVIVTRPTVYEELLDAHGTHGQARFWLGNRGQRIEPVVESHERHHAALKRVREAVPLAWRLANLDRSDLDRFLFEPDDIVLAVGQDGLVANVARFLDGQRVLGVNADPSLYDGVLAQHAPDAVAGLLSRDDPALRPLTLVEVRTDEGEVLRCLNEVFIGHRSHQSARYVLHAGQAERQSSSGLIVATGTGATGWASSIHRERVNAPTLPGATDGRLVYFVREAFYSRATRTTITGGVLQPGESLEVVSEMNEGGVVFGDGIERDFLPFGWGKRLTVSRSERTLNLVVKPGRARAGAITVAGAVS